MGYKKLVDMSFSSHEFSKNIDIAGIKKRKRYQLHANREQCVALARRFGVQDIVFLNATIDIEKNAEGVIQVQGHFESEIIQTCIVTLDPVISVIAHDFHEAFKTVLVPQAHSEVFFSHDTTDFDFIQGGQLDIGEIVAQNLALMINPYPRSEHADVYMATFQAEDLQPGKKTNIRGPFSDATEQNPFERLKRMLKKSER